MYIIVRESLYKIVVDNANISLIVINCKILLINPGPIQLHMGLWIGLQTGRLISRNELPYYRLTVAFEEV